MSNPNNGFLEEAYELVTELESALLALEENSDDMDLIGRIFRSMHTIKGSGAMFGYDNIASFTHELESAFDLVREGKMLVSTELVSLSLSARDQIKAMLDASVSGDDVNVERSQMIIEGLQLLISSSGGSIGKDETKEFVSAASANGDDSEDSEHSPGSEATYRIRFKPDADIFRTGTNPILLLKELQELGPCRVIAQTEKIPELNELDSEGCFIYWDIILTTSKSVNDIEDVFIFVANNSSIKIDVIDDASDSSDIDYKLLGQILVERGDLTEKDLEEAIFRQKRIG